MALRDQPYFPLYIQDFMTDEKLSECSAAATGVYIRLMCLMHKSENYGKILLKQKHKQKDKQILNFASQVTKNMPYDFTTVLNSLVELVDEKVLLIEGDFLIQKRMVKDNEISEKRSVSGKIGGLNSTLISRKKLKDFAKANVQANSEYENEYESNNSLKENLSENEISNTIEFIDRLKRIKLSVSEIESYFKAFKIHKQQKNFESENDYLKHFRDWLKFQVNGQVNKTGSKQSISRSEAINNF